MKPRHLSPSALEAWDWCPLHRYAKSYKDNVRMSPNTAVWFGTACHAGLEAAYTAGTDWELAFLRSWRQLSRELEVAERTDLEESLIDRSTYSGRGLALIQSVVDLKIEGEPEVAFTQTLPGLSIPVKGRIDLVDTKAHRIYDFKTSNRGWSAAMAAKKVWQPALYSAVYEAMYQVRPSFAYVILPVQGSAPAFVLEAPRTPESQAAAIVRAQQILERIWAEDWGDCTCPDWYLKKQAAA